MVRDLQVQVGLFVERNPFLQKRMECFAGVVGCQQGPLGGVAFQAVKKLFRAWIQPNHDSLVQHAPVLRLGHHPTASRHHEGVTLPDGLQYLSFETMESMLYSMKSLNLAKFQTEFLMLTRFHADEFKAKVQQMPIEDHTRDAMIAQVDDFMAKLFELADFDPEAVSEAPQFISEVRLAHDKVLAFSH